MDFFADKLVKFSHGTDLGDIPDTAKEIAQISFLDWLGVLIAGQEEPVAQVALQAMLAEGSHPVSSVVGQPRKLSPRAAALVNGTTSHALDYDDTHFLHIGHLSTVIMPACFAAAEKTNATGADLLRAIVIGFEAACRVGDWLGSEHYEAGFHQTATAGGFGAALAVARLYGLEASQYHDVLGLSATRMSGLKNQFGSFGKPYNAGMAAANAIEVCELVTHGMTSVHGALDGEFGFGATHFGAQKDPHQVVSDLGSVYKMCDVRYKFHACCHGTHAALEAFSKVRPKDLPRARVTVFVHPKWLDVCNIDAPQTGLQAKFSYKHVLALMALGYDTGQLDSFTDAICEAPEIATFRNQISVVAAPELTDSQARVEVDVDGARQQAFFDLHSPTDLDALRIRVEEKFKKLVPPQDVKALIDLSYPLARLATLDPIAERISAAKNKAFQSL